MSGGGRIGVRAFAGAIALLAAAPSASQLIGGDEELYRERFAALMRDKGVVTDPTPLEPVPGVPKPAPLPVASRPSIAADALSKASAYAAANRSSAFMVWRDGALQAARYFGGTIAATPLVSKSLSKPLGAIAVGRAIRLGRIKSLDQPVADFIPEWRGTPKAAMLVRHLLDMRSGLLEQGGATPSSWVTRSSPRSARRAATSGSTGPAKSRIRAAACTCRPRAG